MSPPADTGPDPDVEPTGPAADDAEADSAGAAERELGPQPRPRRGRPSRRDERGPDVEQ